MTSHKKSIITSNADKQFKARLKILAVLSDGKWHRNMKLKETTKLSSRTLDKHLDYMKNSQIIEKKTDVLNGKYAVLFKAKRETITYYKAYKNREIFITESEKVLSERKDPFIILDAIHGNSQTFFIFLLKLIQQNKKITNEEIDFFGDCFLWTNYKQWISELTKASRKIINDLNINQLLIKQATRQTEFWKDLRKRYEKIIQQNNPDVP